MGLKIDNIRQYIANLIESDFIQLCDRYLKYYENGKNKIRGSLLQDEYLIIGTSAFTVFVPYEDEKYFSPPETPLPSKCGTLFLFTTRIRILDPDPNKELELNKFLNGTKLEIWAPSILAKKIKKLPENIQQEILGEDDPITKYAFETVDIKGLLRDFNAVADHLVNVVTNPLPKPELNGFKYSKTTSLMRKLKFNFSRAQDSFAHAYRDSFNYYFAFSRLIEFKEIKDTTFVTDWRLNVQQKFVNLANTPTPNSPINGNVFNKLATEIESHFKTSLSALSCAYGIIIYFFERCDIGARNRKDTKLVDNRNLEQLKLFRDEL